MDEELRQTVLEGISDAIEKDKYEALRLHFTDMFLQHPNMLSNNTFKQIVTKAALFTKIYMEYGTNDEPIQ